jgi:hypothetical protein
MPCLHLSNSFVWYAYLGILMKESDSFSSGQYYFSKVRQTKGDATVRSFFVAQLVKAGFDKLLKYLPGKLKLDFTKLFTTNYFRLVSTFFLSSSHRLETLESPICFHLSTSSISDSSLASRQDQTCNRLVIVLNDTFCIY